jgi:hypothetical protein
MIHLKKGLQRSTVPLKQSDSRRHFENNNLMCGVQMVDAPGYLIC